eukprot:snap_masked-scaffold_11-processed-gene-4.14-mRNA-1 protein AED:0.42 eAED:0.49 QI:0/-1/0/1/-1/1/1/0/411
MKQEAQTILQVPRTHIDRLVDFLSEAGMQATREDMHLTQESIFIGKVNSNMSFIRICSNNENSMLNIANKLMGTSFILRYVQKVLFFTRETSVVTSRQAALDLAAQLIHEESNRKMMNLVVTSNMDIFKDISKLYDGFQNVFFLGPNNVYDLDEVLNQRPTCVLSAFQSFHGFIQISLLHQCQKDIIAFIRIQQKVYQKQKAKVWPCRARLKLEEALERLSLLNYLKQQKKNRVESVLVAVDIGSSPGGWTYCLSDIGSLCDLVISVDPGKLSFCNNGKLPENVFHFAHLIQDFKLKDFKDSLSHLKSKRSQGSIQLLICSDMNVPVQLIYKLTLEHLKNLFSEQEEYEVLFICAVLTAKKFKGPSEDGIKKSFHEHVCALEKQLRADFKNTNSLQLMGNTTNEKTVVAFN